MDNVMPMPMMSTNVDKIIPALHKAQAAIKPAIKGSLNPHFKSKYADLAAVWDAVKGPATDNGLVVIQSPEPSPTGTVLRTTIFHTSGQWVCSLYPLNPVKNDPQAQGSAMTYARRYTLAAMFCVPTEDDDGNAASAPAPTQTSGSAATGSTVANVHMGPKPYKVTFATGETFTFFDDALLAKCVQAHEEGSVVKAVTTTVNKGGKTFTNLVGIDFVTVEIVD